MHSPIEEDIKCKRCSKRMIFMGQVYAPTDVRYNVIVSSCRNSPHQVDRSLYFFVCLSSCSSSSLGWLVYRDQNSAYDVTDNTPSIPPAIEAAPQPSTDWNALCGGSGVGGGWGEEDGEEEDFSDIMALLDSRDGASGKEKASSKKIDSAAAAAAAAGSTQVSTMCAANGSRMYILDELDEPAQRQNGGAMAADHVDELVMRYLADMRGEGSGAGEGEGDPELSRIEEEYSRERTTRQVTVIATVHLCLMNTWLMR
jgi:hypothetical protein